MQTQIRKILFATDFSEPALQAQRYAMALTEQFQAELHLLHVIVPIPISAGDMNVALFPQDTAEIYQLEHFKQKLAEGLGEEWVSRHHPVCVAEVGFTIDQILRYARDHQIDLIVCGTHGHTGFSHLLLGSVAEKLVRMAGCPVLTVHPQGHQFVLDEEGVQQPEMVS